MVNTTIIKNPSWWKRRARQERCLFLTTSVSIIISLLLLIALIIVLLRNTNPTEDYCLTPDCFKVAGEFIQDMDPSIEPCDDFYTFACGNFVKNTIMQEEKSFTDKFTKLNDLVTEQVRIALNEKIRHKEAKSIKLVKNLYALCLNKTKLQLDNLKTIKAILSDLGGWPVLESEDRNWDDFDWIGTTKRSAQLGLNYRYYIDFQILINIFDSTKRNVSIDQPTLPLDRKFLVKGRSNNLVKAYFEHMTEIAQILGADRNRSLSELSDALNFEIQLAKILVPDEQRRDIAALFHLLPISELNKKYPVVDDWLDYINSVLHPDAKVALDDVILFISPEYFGALKNLLENTPKKTQANYFLWRQVSTWLDFLNDKIRESDLKFRTAKSGVTKLLPRWRECFDNVKAYLPNIIGALYIRRFFDEETKKEALKLVTNVQNQFKINLKTINWMDSNTKSSALDKINAFKMHIAYPDELISDQKLDEVYGNIQIDEDNLLTSIINVTRFLRSFEHKRILKPVNKTEWIEYGNVADANSYYSAIGNSIRFPAGIWQGTFFGKERPQYLNYGAIGRVIGHEITHGFDDQGKEFDKDGNQKEWWSPETRKRYIDKAKCIEYQYGNFTLSIKGETLNINGITTQGENIADNGGIKLSYQAYNNWVKNVGEEKKLPGLNYTPKQLFWISTTNMWCAKYRPEFLKEKVITQSHPPSTIRVLGMLTNSEDFTRDFNCPVGSKMNPRPTKCQVW